jgi:hypothetical protein
MEQTLKIKIKDDQITLLQVVDQKEHELANRSFHDGEWNKMVDAFRSTFVQPKTFAFTEIDWWVAVDEHGRGNWKKNFYKLVVKYKNGFTYKIKSFNEFNNVFGMKFQRDTTFDQFKETMKRIHDELKTDQDPEFNIVQSEFDVS